MRGIGDFLSRYLGLRAPGAALADALREALLELFGEDVPTDRIRIAGGVAFIQAPSVLKSEIAMRKEELLKVVFSKVGEGLREIR